MSGQRLAPAAQRLLCDLADPQALPPDPAALAVLDLADFQGLCEHHGIGAVVWRKLKAAGIGLAPDWQAMRDTLGREVRLATIVTLDLEAHGQRLRQGLEAGRIAHRFVKGAAFADALYPHVSDRPYTDIDLVVPHNALAQAGHVLEAMGFAMVVRPRPEKTVLYEEQKWTLAGQPHLLIEVHTDLVHMPALRRRVRFGFEQLQIANGGQEEGRSSMAGHLLTAVVHATIGHKFHQLKLAVDVLQAIRRLDDADMEPAIAAAQRLDLTFELAAAAGVAARVFDLRATEKHRFEHLARLANVPGWINRDTVVNAHLRADVSSRVRRHVFRWQQRLVRSNAAQ